MQPYIFPYIGYFQLINLVDKFIIYDDVDYITRGWINRNRLLINGQANLFTIPLKKASQNRKINQIRVQTDAKWQKKLLKTIELNYRKAPFFNDIYPLLLTAINNPAAVISEFNLKCLKVVCSYLEINTELVCSSLEYDNQTLAGQKRILDICKVEKASQYINPIGGKAIYDAPIFENENIKLCFLESVLTPYTQFDNEFTPWLSIIDLLMFNSQEEISYILNKYTLV